jgi:hypothetical protein
MLWQRRQFSSGFRCSDMEGIIHSEFVFQGEMVNLEFYKDILQCLREAVWQKTPEKWRNRWLLHDNITPCHTSQSICEFLTGNKDSCVTTTSLLSTLSLCDFGCSPVQRNSEREAIWHNWRHHFQHDMIICGWFQKKISRNVSSSERSIGTSVCMPEGSILKRINDEIGIQSFTKFFDQTLYSRTHMDLMRLLSTGGLEVDTYMYLFFS